jgi:4-hydroxy-tetrahydrodipicolinate reductase
MNITIIGYGRMGNEVERAARLRGIKVASIIDPSGNGTHRQIDENSMRNADVCIDFTAPNAVLGNIEKISRFRKNIVVGTTGWNDKIGKVRKIVNKRGIGLIHASNFSIGVNLFFRMVENAARLINETDAYDIYGCELHHNKKTDSPSGTAKTIGDILIKNIKRKNRLVFDRLDGKIRPNELHFASVRAGSIPGTHIVGFDSSADTIELKHEARNREGFALGAIMAAKWISGKKGLHTIDDMMKDMLGV